MIQKNNILQPHRFFSILTSFNGAGISYKISILFFIFSIFFFQRGFSQKEAERLPKTIVFKIKETHRASCFSTKIVLPKLNKALALIGVYKLEKIFPKKEKANLEGYVDLSLIYELKYYNNYSVEEVIRKIRKLKITEYVEPYYIPQLTYTPSDTVLSRQYYITLIRANDAWDITTGDPNIVIGITDTGWDPTHPDLLANIKLNHNDPINGIDDDADGYIDNYMGWDLGMNDNNALWESSAHGTNVTGIAAAVTDNITGVSGVGFNTHFLPIKISNAAGVLTKAYQGIVYAADHNCFVINCSWGGFNFSQFNQDVIDYATINKGCLVVGAVGNNDLEEKFYPAGYKGVLSVANSDENDLKSLTSNYGYYVDVSAPGENMWTTSTNGSFGTNGGTSMAAPVISGGAALLKAQFPLYNNYQIAALIQATADDLTPNNPNYIDKIGSGRLNLFKGVTATSPQFLALTNHIITDNNDNNFVFGDTLFIEAFFENYLNPITAITVTITSTSPYVNIIDGTTNLPALGTLASASNGIDKFKVKVLSGASLNEIITFKAVVTNGTYTNNEYFTVTLNPDYINLAENLVSTSITSNGRIGYVDNSNTLGLGFEYDGNQLLYEAGLMIGYNLDRVEDAVRGNSGQDSDFGSQQNVSLNPPYTSEIDVYNVLYDRPSFSNSWIEQFSYAYANDKYVIIVYKIDNISATSIPNIYAGIFADWDIDDAASNKSGYDAFRKMGYVHSLGSDTIYAAIKLLSIGNFNNYSLDLDGSGGVNPNGGGFTTAEKYTTLSTTKNTAGGTTGADVAHVVSSGGFNLNAGEHAIIAFAIIAGDSLLDIQNSADEAQIRYNTNALSVEKLNNNNIINIYPNPTNGKIKINSSNKVKQIIVRNVLGETVKISYSEQVNISNQPNGIYFVEVITTKNRKRKKIVLFK